MGNDYKIWSGREEEILEKMATSGLYSYKEIGKLLNRSSSSCQSHAVLLKIKNSYYKISGRKYSADDSYWNNLTPSNCYWAGLIAADGYIYTKKNSLKLEISTKDKSILERFKRDIKYTGNIKDVERSRNNKIYKTSVIKINSKQIIASLQEKFNLSQKKSYNIKPPNIQNNYLKLCFLIGYIDGDGCIHKVKNREQLMVNVTSASHPIIEWIKTLIEYNFPQNLKNRSNNIRVNKNYSHYSISGIKACVLVDSLSKFPIHKLDRKWNSPSVISYIESQKEEYPYLFQDKIITGV